MSDIYSAILAEVHVQHDLQDCDRDALQSAASKSQTWTTIGSILGLGLGVFFAVRSRRSRMQRFSTFRTHEQPMHVVFADGRIEAAPNLAPVSKPSTLGHIATYALYGLGGCLIGRATGIFTGGLLAASVFNRDRESRERISTAMKRFRADALRNRGDALYKKADAIYKKQDAVRLLED